MKSGMRWVRWNVCIGQMKRSVLCTAALAACVASPAWSQAVVPGAGDALRDLPRAEPQSPPPVVNVPSAPAAPTPEVAQATAEIRGVRFEGATLVSNEDLQEWVSPYIGRRLSLPELEAMVRGVSALYRERGWLASASLPPQEVVDGVIRVVVTEARLEGVNVQAHGTPENEVYLRELATQGLAVGGPISLPALERGLLLANEVPGTTATGVLEPGSQPGQLLLRLNTELSQEPEHSLALRNFGARATGEEQVFFSGARTLHRGYGERVFVTALASQGLQSVSGGLSGAVGNKGGRMGLSFSHLRYEIIRGFTALEAEGEANTVTLGGTYPWLRSEGANIRLGADFTYRGLRDYALQTQLRNRRLTLGSVQVDADRRDAWGGGGVTFGFVRYTHGIAKLRNVEADIAADRAGPQVQGHFNKLGFRVGRLQRLGDDFEGYVALTGQWASKNLDSSERFVLGGPSNVRGYPVGEGVGDQGYIVNVEVARQLHPAWKGFAFFDAGHIRVNTNTWPGSGTPNSYSLYAIGLGARWTGPDNWSFQGLLAQPLKRNPLVAASGRNQDGSSRSLRAWVSLQKDF